MTLVLADRVQESSMTTGLGTFDLQGAQAGYQSFIDGIGATNQTYYGIICNATNQWEVGLGTVVLGVGATPNRLTRDVVYEGSSGKNTKVNFGNGKKDVFVTVPGSKLGYFDPNSNAVFTGLTVNGTATLRAVLFGTDSLYDVGAAASGRPRDVFVGRNLTLGSALGLGSVFTVGTSTGTSLISVGLGIVGKVTNPRLVISHDEAAQKSTFNFTYSSGEHDWVIQRGGVDKWKFSSANYNLLAATDGVATIGAVSANRPQAVYASLGFGVGVAPTAGYAFRGYSSQAGGFGAQFQNPSDNPAAYALVSLVAGTTGTASGYVAAFPDAYSSAALANRVALVSNSDAAGLVLWSGGAGTDIQITPAGTPRWSFSGNGHLLATTDNTVDVGASAANRPRNIYAASSVLAPAMTIGSDASAAASYLYLNSAAGQYRGLLVRTAGGNRWVVAGNTEAESGADAGTNFQWNAYSDTGVLIDVPLKITRALNGLIAMARPVQLATNGTVYHLSLAGASTTVRQIQLGSTSNWSVVGTRYSGGDLVAAFNASQTAVADAWAQSASTNASMLLRLNSSPGFALHAAPVAAAPGDLNTFWGQPILSVTTAANMTLGTDTNGALGFNINGAASNARSIVFKTANVNRWTIMANGTESGSDAGAAFSINAYSDTGVFIDAPLSVLRAAGGAMTLSRAIVASSGIFTLGTSALASAVGLNLSSAAGQMRDVQFNTGGVGRWSIRVDNAAETGSNAGSNFAIYARDDAGAAIDAVIAITRVAGGAITLGRPLRFSTDNSFDIGATAANRPRDGYFGNSVVAPRFNVRDAAGTTRDINFYTAASARWTLRATADAESGSNAGTNLQVLARDDSGSIIDTPLQIARVAGGTITLNRALTFANDNLVDIGASSGSRPRSLFVGTSIVLAGTTSSTYVTVSSNAATNKGYRFQSAGVDRWLLYSSALSEGGSNSGSPLSINAYDDAGVSIDTPLTIARASGGLVLFARPTQITKGLGIFGSNHPDAGIRLSSNHTSTSANLYGIINDVIYPATATGVNVAGYFRLTTAAAAFTMASAVGLRVANASVGAGSTITAQTGLLIDDLTSGATNWAIVTGAGRVKLGDSLIFATDNASDIGSVGANRPRNIYAAGSITAGQLNVTGWTTSQAATNGTTDARATLNSENTAVGTSGKLVLAPGTYRVASALTFTCTLERLPGAVIKPDSGITVTIDGPTIGPDVKWIDTSAGGKVVFTPKSGAKLSPRWWGAKGDYNHGTATGTDDSAAFQAMTAATSGNISNGWEFDLGVGSYYLTSGFTISTHYTTVRGRGRHATQLVFAPTADNAVCVKFDKGAAAELFVASLSGVGFHAKPGNTFQKVAIELVDTSEVHLDEIAVHNSWTSTGRTAVAPSIGLRVKGREALHTRNLTIAADRPIHVTANPNHTYDFDVISMSNTYLLIQEATESAMLIDSGTYVQNFVFSGSNIFTGGKNGIYWADGMGASAATRSIRIENLRHETTATTGGSLVRVEKDASSGASLILSNLQPSFDQNLFLRGVNHVTLEDITFSGATGKVPLDIDNCNYVFGRNVSLQAGNSVNMGLATAVNATVSGAGAAAGATSIPVNALAAPIPSGAALVFISGPNVRYAKLTAQANAGATTLAVQALAQAIAAGYVATYEGLRKVYGLGEATNVCHEPDFLYTKATTYAGMQGVSLVDAASAPVAPLVGSTLFAQGGQLLTKGSSGRISTLTDPGVISVRDFWPTANPLDHTTALAAALAALQANGGGTLIIPAGTRIGSTDYSVGLPSSPLFAVSNLKNARIIGMGVLNIDRTFAANDKFDVFQFTDCQDLDIQLNVTTPTVPTMANNNGPTVVKVLGASRNVTVRGSFTGCYAGMIVNAAAGAADTARTKGVRIDLVLKNTTYGYVGEFSGDDLQGRIVSDTVGRSLFVYGMSGGNVEVESKNNQADDCLFRGYSGQGVSNFRLRYVNKGSTTAGTAASCVLLAPDVSTGAILPATFRNLDFDIHVEYTGTAGPGHAFQITKNIDETTLDTVDRGHVIDGLTVALTVKGQNSLNSANPWVLTGTWGATNDTFRNWKVTRALLDGVTTSVVLNLTSLKDRATFSNVVSSSYWELSAGTNGRISCYDCKAPALCASSADTSWIDYVNCHLTTSDKTATTNKTYWGCDTNGPKVDVIGRSGGYLSFFGGGAVTKPSVTGAKGGNAALTSLLSQLAALGLITDSTT